MNTAYETEPVVSEMFRGTVDDDGDRLHGSILTKRKKEKQIEIDLFNYFFNLFLLSRCGVRIAHTLTHTHILQRIRRLNFFVDTDVSVHLDPGHQYEDVCPHLILSTVVSDLFRIPKFNQTA